MTIDVERVGHVARLTFANPPLNHATVALLQGLAEALGSIDADPALRSVLLASKGNVFCSGADLVAPGGLGAAGDDPLREFYGQAARLFATAKPIVVAIQGAAVGAGLGLALAADFRVASTNARFAANFVKLGFHPGFGLTYTLPRLLGEQRAATMMMTGDRYRPGDTVIEGLVDRVVEPDQLEAETLAFADAIAVNAPLSLIATRATLRAGLEDDVRSAMAHERTEQIKLWSTDDYAEGVRAVTERRPGNFTGR